MNRKAVIRAKRKIYSREDIFFFFSRNKSEFDTLVVVCQRIRNESEWKDRHGASLCSAG